MLWVLKRTVSMRRSFWAPKTNVYTEGKENIRNAFKIKLFLISQPKHMLWVLKRTISMRQFHRAPKTKLKLMNKKTFTILCI